jgi:5-(carboxyamino)imidazole ribonucleotide synthase
VNVLGQSDAAVPPTPAGFPEALSTPGAHVHLYGKRRSRPGRKMGHVTSLGPDLATAEATSLRAAEAIRL